MKTRCMNSYDRIPLKSVFKLPKIQGYNEYLSTIIYKDEEPPAFATQTEAALDALPKPLWPSA